MDDRLRAMQPHCEALKDYWAGSFDSPLPPWFGPDQCQVQPTAPGGSAGRCRDPLGLDPGGEGTTLFHAWRDGKGQWRTEEAWRRSASNQYPAVPSIAVDSGGNAHLIAQRWQEGPHGSPIVYLRKPPGGRWSREQTLQEPGGQAVARHRYGC